MNYKALKIAALVDSKNQMKDSPSVRFENLSNEGLRVLFVGNSVTLHGPSEPIGWFGDWGMAASGKEKDYVHLVEDHIKTKYPNASFCICNAADWERRYKNSEETFHIFEAAREFDADIMILKLCANSPKDNFDAELFKSGFEKLINFFNKSGKAKVIVATEFLKHPAEDSLISFAKESGFPLCYLSDIADFEEYKAIGLFEHKGVAGHPGDKGMREIADRIIKTLDQII